MTAPARAARFAPSARAIDAAAIAAFCIYGLVLWWPTRELPYFWDSAGLFIPSTRDMFTSGFWPLVPTREYYAHPPLFFALVAFAWRVFGESRLVAHAVVLPFFPMAMIATYRIGARLHDRLLGFAAAVLFGALAVALCELGQVYLDLPVAAIAACALWAWVVDRPILAGAIFAVAAWTKIPAATIPFGLAVALAFDAERRRDARRWIGLAIPVAALAAWFVYHHHVAGWWIADASNAYANAGGVSATWSPSGGAFSLGHRVMTFVRLALVARYRFALIAIALVAGAVAWRRGVRTPWRDLLLLAACIAPPAALFIVTAFMTRYALLVFPAMILFALLLARTAFSTRVFLFVSGALLAAFVTTWHPKIPRTNEYEWSPNEDLSYLDMIHIGQRASAYLEKKHGDAEIYGGFHEQYELGDPGMGYVTRALDVRRCDHFSRSRAEQLVFVHAYSPEETTCRLVTQKTGAIALTRFESNGKWLEIWRVPPPP